MILIQAATPLACVFGLLFAAWFLFDLRLRSAGPDEVQSAVSVARRESARQFGRYAPFAGIGVLVVVPTVAGLVGWAHESVEDSAYVAAAAGLGALLSLVLWMASPSIAVFTAGRTAAAISSEEQGGSPALAALWGSASASLIAGALAIGTPVALFGAYTAGIDIAIPSAPQLIAGFAAGVAAIAGSTRLASAVYASATEDSGSGTQGRGFAGLSGSALGLASLLALAVVASSAPAGVLWVTTGEAAWMLLPAVVLAFGLFASTLAAITLAFWTRLASPLGAARMGFWTVAVLSAAAATAAPLAMPEGSIILGLAGLAGVLGSFLLVFVARQSSSAAWVGVVVIAVVVAGAALGREADLDGVAPELAGLLGLNVAIAGFLMSAAYISSVRGASSLTADALGIASPPDSGELDRFRNWSTAKAGSYGTAALLFVAVLAGAAILSVARMEIGASALDDHEAYLELAEDLNLLPDSPEFLAEESVRLANFAEYVTGLRPSLTDEDAAFLFVGHEGDIRYLAATRLEEEQLSESDAAVLAGGPLPLPRILPLEVTALPTLAGAIAGLAAAAFVAALLKRTGRDVSNGRRSPAIPALAGLVVLLAIPAVAVVFRFVVGGVAGWQFGAGLILGIGLTSAALASGRNAVGGAMSGAILVIAVLLAIAPVLVP